MKLFRRTYFTDSLLLSLLLHLFPILAIILASMLGEKVHTAQQAQYEVQSESTGGEDIIAASHLGEGCRYWYGGIGIQYSLDKPGYVVSRVVEGYPAYDADIRVGDEVVNDGEIRGEPGTVVRVSYKRKGVMYTKLLQRDKICYSY